jgi:2-dehydro-3-deoxygluconokinase
MKSVITFGEIMGRIATKGHARFRQALPGEVVITFAGAEANVAASLAMLGQPARFVTALPADSDIADACEGYLRNVGIDTSRIVRADGRMGMYYVETGANQRPSKVTYDREGSAVACAGASAYDWESIISGADWFHFTGITPAISAEAADATRAALDAARAAGLTVSCDLNFRKKLWRWEAGTSPKELAGRVMSELLPLVDVLIANEGDADDVLGIRSAGTDVESGQLSIDQYPEVAREIVRRFPNIGRVGITLRESMSADWNNWGAMLYDGKSDQSHFAPVHEGRYSPYPIRDIVDRVGAGDAFGAGLIHAMCSSDLADPDRAVQFAAAASCLAHSIEGDFNFSTRDDIERLMAGSASGRVIR